MVSPSRFKLGALAILHVLIAGTVATAALPPVVLTTDSNGALLPCPTCPSDAILGGVSRRVAAIESIADGSNPLRLDAGGFLFGPESPDGEAVAHAYSALKYDALNISFRDFRAGGERTVDLVTRRSLPGISANLVNEAGERLFPAFIVVDRADARTAVIGITERPASLDYLRHLKKQLEGVSILPPRDVLPKVLAEAGGDSDQIVLLAYGTPDFIAELRREFGDRIDLICAGGARPVALAGLNDGASPSVIAGEVGGTHITYFADGMRRPRLVPVSKELPEDPELVEIVDQYHPDAVGEKSDYDEKVSPSPLEADAALDGSLNRRSAETAGGTGILLSASKVAIAEAIGDASAGEDRVFVIFDMTFENDLPFEAAFSDDRAAGERLLVALRQKLFLVIQPRPDAPAVAIPAVDGNPANGLLASTFELRSLGNSATGKVAFEVPESHAGSNGGAVEIRLYHDELAAASLAIRGELGESMSFEEATSNQYVAVAEPAVRFPDEVDGKPAPTGMRWVEIDLVGRSLVRGATETEKEAAPGGGLLGGLGSALDGPARDDPVNEEEPDAQRAPAFYLEAPSYLQLVADGQWARTRESGVGTLPLEPVFLPDRPTGGTAVFLAPDDAESLELVAVFPILQDALGPGTRLAPESLRFAIDGDPVEQPAEQVEVAVEDQPVRMAVLGANATDDEIGAFKAAQGRRLVVLDVRFRNESDDHGYLGVAGRFRAEGVETLGVVGRGNVPLDERVLLPAQSRRALRVVLSVPAESAGNETLELNYAGIAVNPSFEVALGKKPMDESGPTPLADSERRPEMPEDNAAPPTELTGLGWAQPASIAAMQAPPGVVPEMGELNVHGENDGVRLSVVSATLHDSFAGDEPDKGHQFLVLETKWTNLLPAIEGEGEQPPPAYENDLRDSLFFVLNGRVILGSASVGEQSISPRLAVPDRASLAEWRERLEEGEAGRPPRELTGTLAYEVPRGQFRSGSLHLLDPHFGNITVAIAGQVPEEAPPVETRANGVISAAPYGWQVEAVRRDESTVEVVVDLRGRSVRMTDPADFDGRATPLAHLPRLWDAGRLHLLIDGRYAFNVTSNQIEGRLRFLPDATVGGLVRIRVPRQVLESANRVELVFASDEMPVAGEQILRPEPLVFTLKDGTPGGNEVTSPVSQINDGGVVVIVTSVDQGEEHARVRFRVRNEREVAVWFDPREQLQHITADGTAASYDQRATQVLSFAPPTRSERLWIPPGGLREFELAYPGEAANATLRYEGLLRRLDVPLEAGAEPLPPPMPVISDTPLVDRSRQPGGIEAVGLRGQDVNRAIERSRDWLWAELQEDMARRRVLGEETYHLPMLLALIHAKAHQKYPELDSAIRQFFDRVQPGEIQRNSTYKNGFLAMAVSAYGDPAYQPLLRDVARYLIEDQGPDGTWNYNSDIPPRFFQRQPREVAEADNVPGGPLRVIGGPVTTDQAPDDDQPADRGAMRRRLDWGINGDGDNSVTQYAVLGLLACQQGGVEIDKDVWRRLLNATWNRRNADGSWGYQAGRTYGSMACAGATMAVVAMRQLEPDRDPLLDPRLREGMAWLAENWQVGMNPVDRDDWVFYYIYGVERVGRLVDLEFLGPYEWYPILAKWLVAQQSDTGAWPAGGDQSERLSTTFSILFLTRATETLDPEALARERAAAEAAQPTQGRLVMRSAAEGSKAVIFVLDASGSMLSPLGDVAPRDRRNAESKFDLARKAIADSVVELPEGAPVGLIAYGHRYRATNDEADTDVEIIVPVGPLNHAAMLAKLESLRPMGKTPLSLALDQAVTAARRSEGATVILLTDGGQGREPGDPVESARALGAAGLKLEIVGFDIDSAQTRQAQAWSQQLREMAAAAEGRYLPVDDPGLLAPAVAAASLGRPGEYELLDSSDEVVSTGPFGGSVELDPGDYLFRTTFGGQRFEVSLAIARGITTAVEFDASSVPTSPPAGGP